MGTVYQGDLRELVTEPGEALDRPYILCPLHDDKHRPSMRVYPDGAHCFTCGGHLNRAQFSDLFTARELTTAKLRSSMGRPKTAPRVALDPNIVAKAAHETLVHGKENVLPLSWLAKRGIRRHTIYDYRLGHNGVAFTLPVFTISPFHPDTQVLNVRYRRDDAVAPFIDMKYWGLRGYNDLLLYPHISEDEIAFLTEGEFDALLLRQYGLPAFSWINGSSILPTKEQWQHFFPNLKILVRVGDQDAAGRLGSEHILSGADVKAYLTGQIQAHHREGFRDFFPEREAHNVAWDLNLGKDVTALYQQNALAFDALVEHLEGFK